MALLALSLPACMGTQAVTVTGSRPEATVGMTYVRGAPSKKLELREAPAPARFELEFVRRNTVLVSTLVGIAGLALAGGSVALSFDAADSSQDFQGLAAGVLGSVGLAAAIGGGITAVKLGRRGPAEVRFYEVGGPSTTLRLPLREPQVELGK